MTQTLLPLQKVEKKATWLESAVSQWAIVAPQIPPEFTSGDIHHLFGEPSKRNDWGALFRKLQAAKLIKFEGYIKSPRKERRGGVTGLWRKCQ